MIFFLVQMHTFKWLPQCGSLLDESGYKKFCLVFLFESTDTIATCVELHRLHTNEEMKTVYTTAEPMQGNTSRTCY